MAGGRYRSKADLRQEGLAIRNINMRNSLVRVRIALGLGERTSINDLVQASEKLLRLPPSDGNLNSLRAYLRPLELRGPPPRGWMWQ